MKVVHVLPSLSTSWGGPPRVVRDLTSGLCTLGVDNTIVTLGNRRATLVQIPERTKLRLCGSALLAGSWERNTLLAKLAIPSSMTFPRTLVAEVKSADIVHLHEVWNVPHLIGAVVALVSNCPYIISPHGELQPWALAQRRRLKYVARHTYEKWLLRSAAGIHALTFTEKEFLRNLGLHAPVKVIPNGVDVETIDAVLRQEKSSRGEDLNRNPLLLYVGRLALSKGLEVLLDAISEIVPYHAGLSLVLVGPDEQGIWPSLKQRAEKLGIGARVKYLGIVNEPAKYILFASAHVFVLPSSSEGLSVSLLEALACGTPVVITRECNINQQELHGAGYVIDRNPRALAEAVLTILQNEQAYQTMSRRAKSLAAERYSSQVVAAQMVQFYRETIDCERTS